MVTTIWFRLGNNHAHAYANVGRKREANSGLSLQSPMFFDPFIHPDILPLTLWFYNIITGLPLLLPNRKENS